MGKIIEAKCNCGFEQEIFVDRGKVPMALCIYCKNSFRIEAEQAIEKKVIPCPDCGKDVATSICFAPALCEKCKKIIILNYAQMPVICPDCGGNAIFYNESSLQKPNKAAGPAISWGMDIEGDFKLPQAEYKCPSCGQMSLQFKHEGFWD